VKKLALLFSLGTIVGCSVNNQVETLISENSVVRNKTSEGYTDRFKNIYDDFKAYPVSCTEDCYPPSPVIECQSNMQSCQFTGKNPILSLKTGFNVQWFGHASFKVTTDHGQQFLFDPVSGDFDWPVNWAFHLFEDVDRTSNVELSDKDIAKTDAIMYSHIHYDHFKKDDLARIGQNSEFLTPLGFADHFPNDGYKITEMAWYSSKKVGDTTIHFVPANHFSSRIWVPYIYEDNDATLWGGWVIEQQGKKLFFAGDTGYSPHFKDIAAKYGDMDICLIPIASYHSENHPKWYRKVHTTPEDAIIAAQDMNCKVMIPWGYGNASWQMGDKTSHSALFRLMHMRKLLNAKTPMIVLNEGGSVKL
jgi:L-ascorbate metabolism protein UlaG (beta-lactamase superfamily)